MRIATALIGLSLLCAPGAAIAGELTGSVYDAQGNPAAGLVLIAEEAGVEVVTNSNGEYHFVDLPEGAQRIAVSLGAMATQRVSVMIEGEGAQSRNIFLFSNLVVEQALGVATPPADVVSEDELLEAFAVAEHSTDSAELGEPIAWNWRDLDG